MFWGKKSAKKEAGELLKPREIPGLVQKHLVTERKMDPDLVTLLKSVARKSTSSETAFDIRVFDESDALAKKVEVKNYATLDERPDLIICEGWFDEGSKKVELEEKKKVNWDTPIFTEAEIQQKIEALSEPGSTVFFYVSAGMKHGGPLGMGARVVELNPNYPGEKQRKYNLYSADVIDGQPVNKEKTGGWDKPKDIARGIKEIHHKRTYSR